MASAGAPPPTAPGCRASSALGAAFKAGYETCGDLVARAGLAEAIQPALTPENRRRIEDAELDCIKRLLVALGEA